MTLARGREIWLLVATFLIAAAGLIYELIAATLSSYLLGDSVRQFSIVIGLFLSAMGLGAWMSRYFDNAFRAFVWVQILLGICGGFMAPVLFFTYAWSGDVAVPLYTLLGLAGVFSGMEIPLIARVLENTGAAKFRFENVLSVDYIGALVASLAFPFFVIPHLGLMAASLAFGALNLAVAGFSIWLFRSHLNIGQLAAWVVAFAVTLVALFHADRMVTLTEAELFEDDVIFSEATPYQQITVTRFRDRTRLFLDYSIQFDSMDEHRYHEPLVHPAMGMAPRRNQVLVLGGGDGMALREVLRHRDVEAVTLVDLDPRVTEIFSTQPHLAALNSHAFADPRVTVVNQDAWQFVEDTTQIFDVVILDLPDPKSLALSRLYSRQFYGLLVERLSGQGVLVTQAGSPLFARDAFWSVVKTLRTTRNPQSPGDGLHVLPYHTYVPSFGAWGFVLATPQPQRPRSLRLPDGLGYLTPEVWTAAQTFGADTGPVDVASNSLQTHRLLEYYLAGWSEWFD
ncbi:polyamine aminopropyltransferase [Epibacterium sp. MM17-32]|uniref:polyamine aminopropyltransferase n=1 Tax=Epibacterium sp. MM17-32 TaxID=2917734 RepID=UPI001EF5DAEB|nr:polyamine aminopropyltransferase [Epibacterium sp. MM17-32]MCG7630027.1 polyamine aminopropyltransferase [Epibacterium sp. MM17-32]